MVDPTPFKEGEGKTSENEEVRANRIDAHLFFNQYYKSLKDIPTSDYSKDIKYFFEKNGDNTNYQNDELRKIAEKVRRDLRAERKSELPITRSSNRWDKWISAIGIGSFILAALGILFYARTFKQVEPNIPSLAPYVGGIIGIALLLLVIDFGRKQLPQTITIGWLKHLIEIAMTLFFFLIVGTIVASSVILVLRYTGIITNPSNLANSDTISPPIGDSPDSYIVATSNMLKDDLPNQFPGFWAKYGKRRVTWIGEIVVSTGKSYQIKPCNDKEAPQYTYSLIDLKNPGEFIVYKPKTIVQVVGTLHAIGVAGLIIKDATVSISNDKLPPCPDFK